MTVPQWPFSRARPAGYADDDVPQPSELTQIDEQLSRAANGLLYSEVALLKNFTAPVSKAHGSKVLVWEPVSSTWIALGISGGATKGWTSADRGKTWTDIAPNLASGPVRISTPWCAAVDPVGRVLIGTKPNASTVHKIFATTENFETIAGFDISVGGANTDGVTAIIYSVRLGLWIVGLEDGSIWTSPDATTFTLRKAADSRPKTSFAEGADRIVATDSPGDRTHMSLDGITWTTSSSFAGFTASAGLCFVPQPAPGSFLMVSSTSFGTGITARSTDGLTWSQDTAGAAFLSTFSVNPVSGQGTSLIAYGRMAVLGAAGRIQQAAGFTGTDVTDLWYSLDVGLTWKRAAAVAGGQTLHHIAFGDDQFMAVAVDGSDNALFYAGISGGL